MMIPAVVLVLALVASGFSLPVTPEVHVSTENVPQYFTEVPVTHVVEKTGVEGSPETYSSVGQQQQVQSNTPVPKAESAPASVNQPQGTYHERPVLLPVQPLSVVGQAGQVFRPVIVPAEAITAGRVIIAGIETIQQRSFPQGEIVNVENPVPYQQGVNPATYTPVQVQEVQPYYVQTNEKQTPVLPTEQQYTPGQVQYNTEPLIREQILPVNPVPENVEQVQNYNPVPIEPNPQYNPQIYSLPQNVQPIVVQSPEKSGTYQAETGYVPVQTVQQPVQETFEKQGSGYTPVQSHEVEPQTYTGTPTVTENFKKQGEHQQQTYVPVQNQPTYNVQSGFEKQGQYQAHTTEVQQQQVQTTQQGVETQVPLQRVEPVEPAHQQQVYNANPVEQIQPVQAHPVDSVYQQQVYNNNPVEQIQPVQAHPVDSVYQQQVYNNNPVDQLHPVQAHPVNQQVYSAQPVVDQVQSQVPYQQVVQQQAADYVPQVKTSEVEHQQPYVQPQEVVTEAGYNFGDKIHQHTSVHVLSAVPQTQVSSVQPSVTSP